MLKIDLWSWYQAEAGTELQFSEHTLIDLSTKAAQDAFFCKKPWEYVHEDDKFARYFDSHFEFARIRSTQAQEVLIKWRGWFP